MRTLWENYISPEILQMLCQCPEWLSQSQKKTAAGLADS